MANNAPTKEAATKAAHVKQARRAAWTLGFATHFLTEVPYRAKAAAKYVKWASTVRDRSRERAELMKDTIRTSLQKSAAAAKA